MAELSETGYRILNIISKYKQPVGSGTISAKTSQADRALSEATVGRVLRSLDYQGYTQKKGFQGRIVTEKGLEEIKKYREEREKELQMERFLKLSRVEEKEELINMLIARRAIERETARLAAERVDRALIKELKDVISLNERHIEQGLSGAEEDLKFHNLIAVAGQNKILETALKMIRSNNELTPVLEHIRQEVGSTVIMEHKEILKAIESGTPEKAEAAMLNHINSVINDVNKYWDQVHNFT